MLKNLPVYLLIISVLTGNKLKKCKPYSYEEC